MRVDSALACHCFVIIFILLRDKNAAKTELPIELITPSCASLTRGYQQLTHSGSCVSFYDQQAGFHSIKTQSIFMIYTFIVSLLPKLLVELLLAIVLLSFLFCFAIKMPPKQNYRLSS